MWSVKGSGSIRCELMRQEGGEECEECPCLCRTPFSSLASRPPGAYKSQRHPPSLTQLFSPRRLSQTHSSSDPRRPTSSRRQQPQPSGQPLERPDTNLRPETESRLRPRPSSPLHPAVRPPAAPRPCSPPSRVPLASPWCSSSAPG